MRAAAFFCSLFILALALFPAGEWVLTDMSEALPTCAESCPTTDFSHDNENEGCCGDFCNPMQVCAHCVLSIPSVAAVGAFLANCISAMLTPRIKHFEASYAFDFLHPPQIG